MPCATCNHPQREAIDRALALGGPDNSLRRLAQRYGTHRVSLARHRDAHLSPALAQVVIEHKEAGARSALERMEVLYARAQRVLDVAEVEGKAALTLSAVRELRSCVELLARLTGELDERPQVAVLNLSTSPEWTQARGTLLRALAPYPEARAAASVALASVTAGGDAA